MLAGREVGTVVADGAGVAVEGTVGVIGADVVGEETTSGTGARVGEVVGATAVGGGPDVEVEAAPQAATRSVASPPPATLSRSRRPNKVASAWTMETSRGSVDWR